MLRKEKLDNLIELCSLHVPEPWLIENSWREVSDRRKNQLKRYMAAGIYGVISTIGKNMLQKVGSLHSENV